VPLWLWINVRVGIAIVVLIYWLWNWSGWKYSDAAHFVLSAGLMILACAGLDRIRLATPSEAAAIGGFGGFTLGGLPLHRLLGEGRSGARIPARQCGAR